MARKVKSRVLRELYPGRFQSKWQTDLIICILILAAIGAGVWKLTNYDRDVTEHINKIDHELGITAPSALSPPPPPPAAPIPPRFIMGEWSFTSGSYGLSVIAGDVINNTGKELDYAYIRFNLYDRYGAQVGSTLDSISNWEPGVTWRFEAMVIEDSAVRARLKELSGF